MSEEKTNYFDELSPKHKTFLENYLRTLNATKAYKATYEDCNSHNAAAVDGCKLLKTPNIKNALKEYYDNLWENKDDLIGTTLNKLEQMIDFDISIYLDENGKIDLTKIRDEDSYSIHEIKQDVVGQTLVEKTSIKTYDKLKAISEMTKILGMIQNKIDIDINANIETDNTFKIVKKPDADT